MTLIAYPLSKRPSVVRLFLLVAALALSSLTTATAENATATTAENATMTEESESDFAQGLYFSSETVRVIDDDETEEALFIESEPESKPLECTAKEKAYAPACCPLKNPAFESFCNRFLYQYSVRETEKEEEVAVESMPESEPFECDEMEAAFAPSCCPIEDPSFESFCASLFERPHYNSTGMLEQHEPWIGKYDIDGNPTRRLRGRSA